MGFSNKKFKEVWKIFFVWQDDQEERWLRKMSLEGWHLVGVRGLVKYQFVKGEPQDYYYKLDFKSKSLDKSEYVSIFQADGWEYIGNLLLWHYFRKVGVDGQTPEIYTDNQSRIDRNKGILRFIYPVLALNLFAGVMNFYHYISGQYDGALKISMLSMICVGILFYGIYKIKEKNKALEEEI